MMRQGRPDLHERAAQVRFLQVIFLILVSPKATRAEVASGACKSEKQPQSTHSRFSVSISHKRKTGVGLKEKRMEGRKEGETMEGREKAREEGKKGGKKEGRERKKGEGKETELYPVVWFCQKQEQKAKLPGVENLMSTHAAHGPARTAGLFGGAFWERWGGTKGDHF